MKVGAVVEGMDYRIRIGIIGEQTEWKLAYYENAENGAAFFGIFSEVPE